MTLKLGRARMNPHERIPMLRSRSRVLALALLPSLLAGPALVRCHAADQPDPKADDEEFRQKLLEIIEKTVAETESTALDRTDYSGLDPRDHEAAVEIVRRLDGQRMTLNFDGNSFEEGIDFFRDVTGLNIVISKTAQDMLSGSG